MTPPETVVEDVQQAPNASYSYFYDSLSPYGNWVDIRATVRAGNRPWWWRTPLAAVLRSRSLGVYPTAAVLGFGLFMGLGTVSLCRCFATPLGLVLGAGHRLGAWLGELEIRELLLRSPLPPTRVIVRDSASRISVGRSVLISFWPAGGIDSCSCR